MTRSPPDAFQAFVARHIRGSQVEPLSCAEFAEELSALIEHLPTILAADAQRSMELLFQRGDQLFSFDERHELVARLVAIKHAVGGIRVRGVNVQVDEEHGSCATFQLQIDGWDLAFRAFLDQRGLLESGPAAEELLTDDSQRAAEVAREGGHDLWSTLRAALSRESGLLTHGEGQGKSFESGRVMRTGHRRLH